MRNDQGTAAGAGAFRPEINGAARTALRPAATATADSPWLAELTWRLITTALICWAVIYLGWTVVPALTSATAELKAMHEGDARQRQVDAAQRQADLRSAERLGAMTDVAAQKLADLLVRIERLKREAK